MELTRSRLLKLVLPWAACLLLIALLAGCGGGGEDTGNGDSPTGAGTPSAFGQIEEPEDEASPASPEDDTQPSGPAGTSVGKVEDLSPSDILKLIPAVGADNVLYLDVQEAIDALANHREVRGELKDRWDRWFFGDFGIDIADLDYVAFGDFYNGDYNLFLLGGVDTGDLRDSLEESGFTRDEIYGHELWLEGETEFGWAIVILRETVLFADWGEEMVADVLARFTGGLEIAEEVFGSGPKPSAGELADRLYRNEGALMAILLPLTIEAHETELLFPDLTFLHWLRRDPLAQFVGDEDGAEDVWNDWKYVRGGRHGEFARWLAGDRDALEDFAGWLVGDVDTIEDSVRRLAEGSPEVDGRSAWVYDGYAGKVFPVDMEFHEGDQMVDQWLSGDRDVLSHVWPTIAEETIRALGEILPSIQDIAPSVHGVAGDLWASLPPGILKQMSLDDSCYEPYDASFSCERFAHSLERENDQQFRLTGILELPSVEAAQEDWEDEDLEVDDIHEECEATFDIDDNLIKFDALCDAEALEDLIDVD